MTLPLLPDVCLINVLSFLDRKTLYKCLFVNRYYCKLSITIIWREPFAFMKPKILNTLLSCLNEYEISLLVPCTINFPENNQSPLFEYGQFIRKVDHLCYVYNIISWLGLLNERCFYHDCRIQGLVNVIYHMIMRQGSNLQKFSLSVPLEVYGDYIDLPKLSTFMIYKPGITNLRSLNMTIKVNYNDDVKYQNTIEFLSYVSTFGNGIVNCKLWIYNINSTFIRLILDIIKLQSLKKLLIYTKTKDVEKIVCTLKSRSDILKKLLFENLDFQSVDLSFIDKLECIEQLEFVNCIGFKSKHYEALFKIKLHPKVLTLWYSVRNFNSPRFDSLDFMKAMINSFCGEMLLELSLNIVTPETVMAVKESCPNINFLHIKIFKIFSSLSLDSIIPLVCELSSLKVLWIQAEIGAVDEGLLVKILGDYLTYVESLLLNFNVDVPSFEYFANNCKANLKTWNIVADGPLRKDYLICVNNYQRAHNSLRELGINVPYNYCWSNDELEIVDSLKIQAVNISSRAFFLR